MEHGNHSHRVQEALSHEAIVNALFENYESIYAIDLETSAYQCFHESDSFSSLQLESGGDDFFGAIEADIIKTVYPEDQAYVRRMLSREALLAGLEREKYYAFVYRLVIDKKSLYHKLRATKDFVGGRPYILIGVRNIDTAFRLDQAHARELSAMHSKEINHLEAILASSEGYLEANLSRDRILEISPYTLPDGLPAGLRFPTMEEPLSYSDFEHWLLEHLVIKNKERYAQISDRQYLIRCFARGEKRASVSFSSRSADGRGQPCKKVFYLYQDEASGDIMSFCVIYDLTEQQRKEKELRELEQQLQMSRIRNFTGQMQPHFLYNALGSIQEVVLDDPEYASELIGDFTIHLRSCIRAMADDSPIPFDQELANIKAYVNIENMRFGNRLKVVYDIKTRDFSILPLSVQPLVENAIRHGIYERGEAGGTVTIRTAEDADAWRVSVEDTGVGFDVKAFQDGRSSGKRDSAGLKNLMFRLEQVLHASVKIDSRVGAGTTVVIAIPKEETHHALHHR